MKSCEQKEKEKEKDDVGDAALDEMLDDVVLDEMDERVDEKKKEEFFLAAAEELVQIRKVDTEELLLTRLTGAEISRSVRRDLLAAEFVA